MTISQLPTNATKEQYEESINKILEENQHHLDSLDHAGCNTVLPLGYGPVPKDDGTIFFFDIDNCLYKRSLQIHDLMQIFIRDYSKRALKMEGEEANELLMRYYKEYGLAIQGLVKFHKINALDYNRKVDDALPLQDILRPDWELRKMLEKLRAAGQCDRLWLFTNAYKNHGKRVVSLLGVGDMFDGLWYCDYDQEDLVCKPHENAFYSALEQAGGSTFSNCYFVDDSADNIRTAVRLGFKKAIHFVERDEDLGKTPEGALLIRDILDLPNVVPELFEKKIDIY
jgi:pyrimidine and pyridine-specific 5'-nucleotidase